MKGSKFVYISICCGAPATKPACLAIPKAAKKPKKGKKGDEREKAPEYASLGHWSCTQCGKGCKVQRTNKPVEEEKKAA